MTVLRGALLVDGTGAPPRPADVVIDGDRIAPGYFADLVAFDPAAVGVERMERVWDLPAGADRLVARSHGLHQVWVNGELTGDGDGRPRAGRLIRDGGTAAGPVPR